MKFELRYIIPIIILAITAGCSDAPVPACGTGHDMRPLSFSADAATTLSSSRALHYDGLKTQFTDGTLIGCVIAYKNPEAEGGYEYQANSCWTWHSDGLKLTKLLDSDNAPVDINGEGNYILRHFTTEEIEAEELADDPHHPYFIRLLNETADYAFFFYYPYIDADILTNDILGETSEAPIIIDFGKSPFPNAKESQDSKTEIIYNISQLKSETQKYVNSNFLILPVSNDGTEKNGVATSSWKEYTCGASLNFNMEDGDNNKKLNGSDFMYGSVTEMSDGQPLNTENAKSEIPVTMHKKMVTMDLYVLEDVVDGSLKLNPQESNYKPAMKRLKRFNLITGEFADDYNYYDEWNGTTQEKNSRYTKNKAITPCKIGTVTETMNGKPTTYNVYRIILPPQSNSEFRCSLSFRAEGHNNELTLNDMHQTSGIKSLQSGHYYKLRFSKLDEKSGFHIDIDDWQKGDIISINRPD
ncbi:MAG: fimbrillin family protein [Muribaculum sp.]|nr:fimbrillin family protein [Muribaculum sp.]